MVKKKSAVFIRSCPYLGGTVHDKFGSALKAAKNRNINGQKCPYEQTIWRVDISHGRRPTIKKVKGGL